MRDSLGFLNNLSELLTNNLYVKISDISNILHFFHIPLTNVSEIL